MYISDALEVLYHQLYNVYLPPAPNLKHFYPLCQVLFLHISKKSNKITKKHQDKDVF